MRRILIAAGALLLLAGCSSESQTSQTPEETPQPEISLPAALEATTARGTATMDILVLTALGDLEAAVEGVGVIDFANGAAEISWSDEFGDVVERRTPDGLFAQLDPPSGSWFQFDTNNATPTSFALAPLTGLDVVDDVQNEGAERIDGVETTRLVGTTAARDCIDGAGFSEEDALEFGDDVVCGVSIWIDEEGLIVRIDRTFRATTAAGTEARSVRSTTFGDFGSAITVPTPTDVLQAPEAQ